MMIQKENESMREEDQEILVLAEEVKKRKERKF